MPDRETQKTHRLAESGMFAAAETSSGLRERAQGQLDRQQSDPPEDVSGLSTEAVQKLLHELRVHQIELELQNDELRRTQIELEESRTRYFELYDLAPVAYLTIGEKGLIEGANLTAAALLDVGRRALVKQPFTRFIFKEDQDAYFRHRKELLATGATQGCELRLVKPGGEPFWVRLDARAAEQGGARVARTVLSDITEGKRAEQILVASEARHRALFVRSPDALMTLAPPSWRFSSANAAALALFGVGREADFVSRAPWDYAPDVQPDGRPSKEKIREVLALAMQNGAHSFDFTYLRGASEQFLARVTTTRVDVDGSPWLQATMRDETRAQQEQALRAQTERLASMGLLAASVGHEINNPLAYVLANIDDLAQTLPELVGAAETCYAELERAVGRPALLASLGPKAELLAPSTLGMVVEQVTEALDGVRRIALISKVLSTFSRVEQTDLASVDVGHALDCAISMATNEIRFRAQLITDFGKLPRVMASEGKLSQVFLNLLINAAHSIAPGSVEQNRITVRTWATAENACVELTDTGGGMDAVTQGRIFEPFFSTKGLGAGAGLGLSICKTILAECGGDIEVESELGRGSRFLVRIPLAAQPVKAAHATPREAAREPPAIRGRILVVDDEVLLVKLMTRLLAGHEVVSVNSGEAAEALLEQDELFDLILCDLMMPNLTGVDVHRWLHQRNPSLAARVVFTTGGVFGEVTQQYLLQSGVQKLEKPFDAVLFKRVVTERVQASERSSRPPRGEEN
jgi:two-component system, cell cycle sensor histidine kinase and response regulator CckA